MIVVDASVVATALGDDGPDGEVARARLRGERLVAPHLLDVEVVAAWRRMAGAGALSGRRAELARADLRAAPIDRVGHDRLLERAWTLQANLTTYDAVYVALAEVLDAVLVTADRRLASAPGCRCTVELVA
jgi:predicted nucleic acid-binding protein